MFKFRKYDNTLEDIMGEFSDIKQRLLEHYSLKREVFHETKEKQQELVIEENNLRNELELTQNIINKINNLLGERE